ncbi:hypothetical protein [Bathymodiolus japonicus methanotrophic gill symbiont]|uniref:hypothetical protein n=1 Tax=Bathymodiolus japonicus methanotrophic gill symbiont TaxID=113269 RepID=UPI001C8E556D|nr:hypothetical protein [Bathymodiolus japonicus methanotrophic gill symbiont]
MAFYFVSTFANAQTPTKQRPYGYRGLKIFTSLKLRFQDFQRMKIEHLCSIWRLNYTALIAIFSIWKKKSTCLRIILK